MTLTFDSHDGTTIPDGELAGTGAQFAIPKPLYSQVRDMLAGQISSGQWTPGAMLPNEAALAKTFSVSIGTIRRAVEGLEEMGIVIRRQGRGTFVAGLGQPAMAGKLRRLRNPQGGVLETNHKLIHVRARAATPEEALQFKLQEATQIVEFRQAVLVGTKLVGIENSALAGMPPGQIEESLRQGRDPYSLLGEIGLMVIRIEETVSATVAGSDIDSEALLAPPGAPLLQVNRTAYAIGDRLIEMRTSVYLPSQAAYLAAPI